MEIWKDILDYEGLYQVSNLGRVKSLGRIVPRAGRLGAYRVRERILAAGPNSDGYPMVQLSKLGSVRPAKVHILVMRAFEGPCPEGHEVLHRDGDRSNPAFVNLRYGTRKENMADAVAHGTVVGPNNGNAKLSLDQVREIRAAFNGMTEEFAKRFGVTAFTIRNVRAGRTYKDVAR